MSKNFKTPALGEASFSCPRCGALAHQTWFRAFMDRCDKNDTPWIPDDEALARLAKVPDVDSRKMFEALFSRIRSKNLFIHDHESSCYSKSELKNLSISRCFSCDEYSVWLADKLIFPVNVSAIVPNEDMPAEIKLDFIEAATILGASPRGAAALLRLCLQKLTIHLECKGKTLDENIQFLVANGLDIRIQKALDVVRVIGNEAVHPGHLDMKDDQATAAKLFDLVNLIVEATISTPKHIDAMFEALPEGKLKGIARRGVSKGKPEPD